MARLLEQHSIQAAKSHGRSICAGVLRRASHALRMLSQLPLVGCCRGRYFPNVSSWDACPGAIAVTPTPALVRGVRPLLSAPISALPRGAVHEQHRKFARCVFAPGRVNKSPRGRPFATGPRLPEARAPQAPFQAPFIHNGAKTVICRRDGAD